MRASSQHITGRQDTNRLVTQFRFFRRARQREAGAVFDAAQATADRIDHVDGNGHVSGDVDTFRTRITGNGFEDVVFKVAVDLQEIDVFAQ